MFLYFLLFFIVLALYFFNYEKNPRDERVLLFCMLGLALFVGLSDMLGGYDRYIYAELFDEVADAILERRNVFGTTIFELYDKELGYDIFNVLVGLFTRNRYIFIFLVTIVIYALLFMSFRKYMENYAYAVLLFMGLWFFFTFTYLRQVMGVSIAWLSIQYIIDRQRTKFLLVMLIAFLFHNSALIFVPLFFMPIRKFSRQRVIIVMAICFIIGVSNFAGGLFEAYGSFFGANDRADIYAADTSGFRVAYFVEAFFFLSYILYQYDKIPDKPVNIVLLNIGLLFCAVLLLFLKSENGGRLAWYYMIGIISTITYLATRSRKVTYLGFAMLLVSLLLFNRIVTGWDVQLHPYKTFLTNGVRKGDYIYERYEYDENYAVDKFYR